MLRVELPPLTSGKVIPLATDALSPLATMKLYPGATTAVVVVEFPSVDQAREWWASEEYREPKALRQSASITDMILVEGV